LLFLRSHDDVLEAIDVKANLGHRRSDARTPSATAIWK
jgi:hypothetical protein